MAGAGPVLADLLPISCPSRRCCWCLHLHRHRGRDAMRRALTITAVAVTWRLPAALVVCTLVAASGVVAASARSGQTERLVHFVLPGRDTECEMDDPSLLSGDVTCAIHRNRNRCPGPCDLESQSSRRWYVGVTRIASVYKSRRGFPGPRAKVLRRGQKLTVGYFHCASRAAGLTCVSRRSGHGFFLSKNNKNQRLF